MKETYELTKQEADFVDAYLKQRGLPANVNVTFGDVALAERYSGTRSRAEIDDFGTELFPGIALEVPVILANMVCVAGVSSIVAVEREGGLGIIPQMLSLKERLAMLEKIGRSQCALIDNPLSIGPDKTLGEAKQLMQKFGIYSLVVVDEHKKPIGILSTRDWRYETDNEKLVGDLMGGRRKLYTAKKNVLFEDAAKILRKHRIEKLPLVDKKGKLAGLLTAHGLFFKHHHPRSTRDEKGRFLRIGSIGVGRRFTPEHMKEVEAQVRKGIVMLLIDTARAFSVNTKEAIEEVKRRYPNLPLMVGNVSTPEGAKALFSWGADIVKVGQGPGEACRTREVGIGIPQITAIAKCAAIANLDTPFGGKKYIVADGGVKSPGDIVKAIAAGADAVMTGALFIGTDEAEAPAHFNKDGLKVKDYVGSASFKAQQDRMTRGNLDRMRRPEGVSKEVPVTGTVKEVMDDIVDGMRSAMSYMGFTSVEELRAKGRLEMQTQAGLFEGIKKK